MTHIFRIERENPKAIEAGVASEFAWQTVAVFSTRAAAAEYCVKHATQDRPLHIHRDAVLDL